MKNVILVVAFATIAANGFAGPGQYHQMLESRDTSGGQPGESFLWSFNSLSDLISGNAASSQALTLNVASSFNTRGLLYDGSFRQMLEQRDTSGGQPGESFLWSFDTLNDYVSGNASSSQALTLDVASSFNTAALMFDGRYHQMLESRDTFGGQPGESFLWSFDTLSDFVNGNASGSQALSLNVAGSFNTTALFYDGQYHQMLEARDTSGGQPGESFLWSFNSLSDLLSGNASSSQALSLNVASTFRTAAIAYEPVPEPATIAVLGLGLAALARKRRKR